MREIMADMVHQTQDTICNALEQIDGVTCREDTWERAEGGGGRSRVFSGGKVFEKAGVNVSVVHGTLSPQAAKSMGGGQELGEGMHECLNREIEEEFTHFSKITAWKHVYTPAHAFSSKFRPNEQLILNYFMASNKVDGHDWALRTDENLLGMYWLAPKKESAAWFTLDNDRDAFLAFLEELA